MGCGASAPQPKYAPAAAAPKAQTTAEERASDRQERWAKPPSAEPERITTTRAWRESEFTGPVRDSLADFGSLLAGEDAPTNASSETASPTKPEAAAASESAAPAPAEAQDERTAAAPAAAPAAEAATPAAGD